MENKESEIGTEISLSVFWRIFRKNWVLLTVIAVVIAIAIGVLYGLIYTPVYSSRSQFYVSNVSENTPLYSSGQTAGAEAMAKYCASYVNGSIVLERVLAEAELEGKMTIQQLNRMIVTKVDSGSAVFTVQVSGPDAELNHRICVAIEKVLPAYVDYFNQQTTEPVIGDTSSMLKLIDQSRVDRVADNRSGLIQYPLLAGVLALLLCYIILLIVSVSDRTIYGKDDMKEKFPEVSVFGIIPHWEVQTPDGAGNQKRSPKKKVKRMSRKNRFQRANVEERLITDPQTPYRVTDAFEKLCTNVTFCSTGEKGCTIGVLSSTPNSGKSFVMANLAISLSRLIDKKVLLVDADMRCPMQNKIFRVENKTGLSNLLAGQVSMADLSPVDFQGGNLSIITSGSIPPNPFELLASPKMVELMDLWKQEYDYVLLDLPPLGETADAMAISKLMNGFLFVLRSGLSDVRLARETTQMIEEKGAKIFGYILTDVTDEYMGHYGSNRYYKYTASERTESAPGN